MKRIVPAFAAVFLLIGCQSAYYSTMERFGVHKRDILVDRVEDARDAQADGQEQFTSALDQFRAMVEFEGGELEERYDALNAEFEDSEAAAEEIHDRIDAIEEVSGALFDEWEDELAQYSDASLRRESRNQLNSTQRRYGELIAVMREAENRLDPVLDAMRDQVLYLKHNLNARAIQSLRGEVNVINRDVDQLLEAMRKSIAEADEFIEDMRQS
ncbi:DUF2959 domain-containing protein [Gilvimarinus sp. F26214L]|uniref:DUF2959 domain-containing protein n=1 Tax=Gilvimarinus sp. DZF01 TaxID=3461371 RepID=UPI004045B36B